MKSSDSVEDNLIGNSENNSPVVPKVSKDVQDAIRKKEAEKIQKDVAKLSDAIRNKFKFVSAIAIAPAQASKLIEEEYEIPKEAVAKDLVHIVVVVPEAKFKDLSKIKKDLIDVAVKINEKFWISVFTPVDFWDLGLDSKFELFEALSMSFPIYDKNNLMASLRVSQIHKGLVLRKFEKYVTAYVIGGSFVRGEAVKSSDVDVFVVIDDTDVKRMGRVELLEKLRGIILSFIGEANAMANAKIDLNVQTYLMTDFWESIKDAHPVMFTFIRDGIPMYDRGAFLPWKSLLKSGRIKPSSEAIDMFMSSGDKLEESVNKKLLDVIIGNLYWATLTPSQGLLMLYGSMPQGPRDTVKSLKEIFVEKEKLLEAKYADTLEEIAIKYYKGYEHGKVKLEDIDGKLVDRLTQAAVSYIDRLKELRLQIEKRNQEKGIEQIYGDLFGMLFAIFNDNNEANVIRAFDKNYIKTGKFPNRYLENIKSVAKTRKEFLAYNEEIKGKTDKGKSIKFSKDIEIARKLASEVTNALIEYTQRCDFLSMNRSQFAVKGKNVSVFFLENTFVIDGNRVRKVIGSKLIESNGQEFEEMMKKQNGNKNNINLKDLEVLKKEFGDFELEY